MSNRGILIDETGKSYGRLTVLARGHKKQGSTAGMWYCSCSCGNFINIEGQSLRSGNTTSCGCYRDENRKIAMIGNRHGRRDPPTTFWKAYCNTYIAGAKSRNYPFELDLEYFKMLATSNCYYCNTAPTPNLYAAKRYERDTIRQNGTVDRELYQQKIVNVNGIDRVHNQLGYTKENCVACCTTCNMIKRDMSLKDFVKWVFTVSGNLAAKV